MPSIVPNLVCQVQPADHLKQVLTRNDLGVSYATVRREDAHEVLPYLSLRRSHSVFCTAFYINFRMKVAPRTNDCNARPHRSIPDLRRASASGRKRHVATPGWFRGPPQRRMTAWSPNLPMLQSASMSMMWGKAGACKAIPGAQFHSDGRLPGVHDNHRKGQKTET